MESRIVELEAFKVLGMCGRFTPETTAGIGSLWETFGPRMAGVPNAAPDARCLGVCFAGQPDAASADPGFFYMAALEVSSFEGMPIDMVGKIVPANRYAVFTHRGHVSKIPETWAEIRGTWLPRSGFEVVAAPDLELYDERFDPETGGGEFDIYMPVRPLS